MDPEHIFGDYGRPEGPLRKPSNMSKDECHAELHERGCELLGSSDHRIWRRGESIIADGDWKLSQEEFNRKALARVREIDASSLNEPCTDEDRLEHLSLGGLREWDH